MVRVGIAGYGFIGRLHFDAFSSLDDVDVVAVSTSKPVRPGVKRYDNSHELVTDPDVDVVVVALPTFLHAEVASAAIAVGKPTLVEKPLALSLDEAQSLAAQVKLSGVPLQVGQVLRHSPQTIDLAQRLRNPEFGSPVDLTFSRECIAPDWADWLKEPRLSGGALFDLMVHDLDFVYSVYGSPTRVLADLRESSPGAGDHWNLQLTYEGEQDFIVRVTGSWRMSATYPFTSRARCLGTGQVIETIARSASSQIDEAGEISTTVFGSRIERVDFPTDPLTPFVQQAHSFVELVKDPTRYPVPGIHEACEVLKIVEAARASITAGTSVLVPNDNHIFMLE